MIHFNFFYTLLDFSHFLPESLYMIMLPLAGQNNIKIKKGILIALGILTAKQTTFMYVWLRCLETNTRENLPS